MSSFLKGTGYIFVLYISEESIRILLSGVTTTISWPLAPSSASTSFMLSQWLPSMGITSSFPAVAVPRQHRSGSSTASSMLRVRQAGTRAQSGRVGSQAFVAIVHLCKQRFLMLLCPLACLAFQALTRLHTMAVALGD